MLNRGRNKKSGASFWRGCLWASCLLGCALVYAGLVLAATTSGGALNQKGQWVAMTAPESDSTSATDLSPRPQGGSYRHQLRLSLDQPQRLVLDFKNSSVIGHFSHQVFDAQGQHLMQLEGGLSHPEDSEFFLRHGRSLSLAAGDYLIDTQLSSPFYLAKPVPYVYRWADYQQPLRISQALTLLGMGIFLALAFYYLVMGLWRRATTDLLYAGFIVGNLLFNGAAQLVFKDLLGWQWIYLVSAPILVSNLIYIGFVMSLLVVRRHTQPGFYRLGLLAMLLLVSFWPLALLAPNWSLELARYGVAVFALYGLLVGIGQALKRNRVAYFYLIANAAFLLPAFIAITTKEQVWMTLLLVEQIGMVAVLIEVLLLAQVMSYQIGQVYRENADHQVAAEQWQLLDNLAAQVPGVIYQFRLLPDGRFDVPYASDGLKAMFDLFPEEVRTDAMPALTKVYAEDFPAFMESIEQSARTMTPWLHEFRVEIPGQGLRWRAGNSQPELQPDGSIVWHGFITDVTERKLADEKIRHLAQHDSLTQLPNRALFMDRFARAIEQAKRQQQELALLFVDLDDFKQVNDSYGHQIGDVLLQYLAQQLTLSLRASDTAGRIGGDEFMVLLHPVKGEEDALQVARKIQQAIAQPCEFGEVQLSASASIGIALYPDHGQCPETLIRAADTAMYQTKGRQPGQVHLYRPAD